MNPCNENHYSSMSSCLSELLPPASHLQYCCCNDPSIFFLLFYYFCMHKNIFFSYQTPSMLYYVTSQFQQYKSWNGLLMLRMPMRPCPDLLTTWQVHGMLKFLKMLVTTLLLLLWFRIVQVYHPVDCKAVHVLDFGYCLSWNPPLSLPLVVWTIL